MNLKLIFLYNFLLNTPDTNNKNSLYNEHNVNIKSNKLLAEQLIGYKTILDTIKNSSKNTSAALSKHNSKTKSMDIDDRMLDEIEISDSNALEVSDLNSQEVSVNITEQLEQQIKQLVEVVNSLEGVSKNLLDLLGRSEDGRVYTLSELVQALDENEAEFNKLKNDFASISEKLREENEENAYLLEENKDLMDNLREKIEEFNKLNLDYKENTKVMQRIKEDFRELQQKYDDNLATLEHTNNDFKELHSQYAALNEKYNNLLIIDQENTDTLKDITEDLIKITKEYQELNNRYNELNEQHQELNMEYAELNSERSYEQKMFIMVGGLIGMVLGVIASQIAFTLVGASTRSGEFVHIDNNTNVDFGTVDDQKHDVNPRLDLDNIQPQVTIDPNISSEQLKEGKSLALVSDLQHSSQNDVVVTGESDLGDYNGTQKLDC